MSAAGLTILRILPLTCEMHLSIDRTICQPGLGLTPANTRCEHCFGPKAFILWSHIQRMNHKIKVDAKDTIAHASRTRHLGLLNL